MSNFINDRLRAGFDHDESGENSVENNIKDYLNTAWSNNKGSLNDGLFNEAGTSGTEQNGLILNINDRLKNYFGATNINDGIKIWNGVTGEDIYPPVMVINLAVKENTQTSIIYNFTPNEVGKFDCVLLANNSAQPTTTQIRAGQDGSGESVATGFKKLNQPMTLGENTITFSNLTANTSYDLFFTFEDNEISPNESTIVYTELDGSTLSDAPPPPPADNTPPEWVQDDFGNYIWLKQDPSDTVIQVEFELNESGTVYGVVVDSNVTDAPTPQQVKAGTNYDSVTVVKSSNAQVNANQISFINFIGLTANTTYDIYLVAEDDADNLMTTSVKLNNVSTQATSGSFENIMAYRGQRTFVPELADANDFITGNFTLSFWAKNIGNGDLFSYGLPNGYPEVKGFNNSTIEISDIIGNNIYAKFSNGTNGYKKLKIYFSGTNTTVVNSTNLVVVNTDWNHFLFRYNTSSGAFQAHVNNVEVSTQTIPSTSRPNVTQNINKQLTPGNFAGFVPASIANIPLGQISNNLRIDEWCVWNGYLNDDNKTAIYNSGVPFDLSSDSGNYNQSSNIKDYCVFDDFVGGFEIVGTPSIDWETFFAYNVFISDAGRGNKRFLFNDPLGFDVFINDTPNDSINRYNRSQNKGSRHINPFERQSNTFTSGGIN